MIRLLRFQTKSNGQTPTRPCGETQTEANQHPVGTGPFQFKSWQRNAHIKYTKFDGYWQKGKPYLDGLEWVMVRDPMTALSMFKAGAGHVYNELPAKQYADLKASGKYKMATSLAAP